jgi:hypothetical protein
VNHTIFRYALLIETEESIEHWPYDMTECVIREIELRLKKDLSIDITRPDGGLNNMAVRPMTDTRLTGHVAS